MTTPVDQPIIVIGTHRSGTTFLGKVMSLHPDVAYWEEPRPVWSRGNAYKPDDVLTADDARPAVARKIRATFEDFATRDAKPRFAEKTPSNCLRLPFIDAVFPNARFVHIHRDGRAVVNSTLNMVQGSAPPRSMIVKRLMATPPSEWPTLVSRFSTTLGSKLRGKPMAFWGPRPPGWKSWVEANMPRHVLLATQWRDTITPVLDYRDAAPTHRWFDIAYNELTADPVATTRRILDHCGLRHADEPMAFAADQADASRAERWRDAIDDQTLDDIRPVLEPTLNRLGYSW